MKIKNALLVLAIILGLFSCKKSDDSTLAPTPTLSFKLNGTLYSFTGNQNNAYHTEASIGQDVASSIVTADWVLKANNGDSAINNRYIEIGFLTVGNTISTGTYTRTGNSFRCDCYLNGLHYSPGVTCTVNMTSVNSGLYSGTFTATLQQYGNSSTINLTEGKFDNLSYLP
jgi:hypothetical protein